MILLDTDILVHFTAGHAKVTQRVMSATDIIAMTVITKIEVLRGRFDGLMKAADGRQLEVAQLRLDATEQNLAKFVIVPIDAASSGQFNKRRRQRKLKKIGRADLLIASIALAHRATLVSRNLRHFRQVPGLTVENWAD